METLWPRKKDRLFRKGGYRNLSVSIVTDAGLIAAGYKRAGDVLVESLNTGSRDDSLVFPIVFCYRQYVEVQLKVLAESLRDYYGGEFKYNHKLTNVWDFIKQRIASEIPQDEREAFQAVERCIHEIQALDPGAVAFRYPDFAATDKVNHQIDLGNLMTVMNRVATFLDSLGDWVEEQP